MLAIENDVLRIQFHARGAAVDKLIHKPLARNIALSCEDRSTSHHYCGTVVGPIANRIASGQFSIGDEVFHTDQNEGQSTLHGGTLGLSELTWEVIQHEKTRIHFTLHLENKHMGFPGPAQFCAIYSLHNETLAITLEGQSARPNYFNLAPHLYFNLDESTRIDDHRLFLHSDQFLETDTQKIPIYPPKTLLGTKFDFRNSKRLGSTVIDHNFCFSRKELAPMGSLTGASGLELEFSSNQRGLQVYTRDHAGRSHIALEPQDWPNAINQPAPRINRHFLNISKWHISHLASSSQC